ncbi:hypothetical protein L3X38_042696 [Prunus dulcis]|uniref:Uncharacterized protein n=1 Tax=Prunus dulcis TaxID=3755 RepID=A0AAD4UVC1_PRUDU|nr:hypothetical protein L3X38_042696 [Prunus dulcis]
MALITRHCPHLKGKKSKKKTLKVTWDDSGGNDSEQNSSETANFCLIAKDDEDQVQGIHLEVSPEEEWKPEEDVKLVPIDPDKPERKAPDRLAPKLRGKGRACSLPLEQQRRICMVAIRHARHRSQDNLQKRCNFALKRVAIIEAKIDKLLAVGFIEEVSYEKWLANIVLVAKKDKSL